MHSTILAALTGQIFVEVLPVRLIMIEKQTARIGVCFFLFMPLVNQKSVFRIYFDFS